MFLSVDSLAVEIVTAKSSEMNVLIPTGDDFVSFELFIYFKLLLIAFFVNRTKGHVIMINSRHWLSLNLLPCWHQRPGNNLVDYTILISFVIDDLYYILI